MKAFKPDGSRWFAPSAIEVMDEWLEQPELLDWLERAVELSYLGERRSLSRRVVYGVALAAALTEQQQIEQLAVELMGDGSFIRELARLGRRIH